MDELKSGVQAIEKFVETAKKYFGVPSKWCSLGDKCPKKDSHLADMNSEKAKEFMETFGQEVKSKPSFPDDNIIKLRIIPSFFVQIIKFKHRKIFIKFILTFLSSVKKLNRYS